ncbi:MAG TPA: SpoVR family protein, partial [Rhizomicrobium sp.]
ERSLEKRRRRMEYEEVSRNELWRTLPAGVEAPAAPPILDPEEDFDSEMKLPEENLLYFIEKHSPVLRPWQRELLRIVRSLAQYFYPQRQTKVMNEGCASFVHHRIMHRLYDRGSIGEGSLLEFLHSHTGVIFQPEFDDPRFGGINPYALGFGMMTDIRRICEEPTAEDRDWFPRLAGSGDWMGALRDAWANYRDESFVEQFLSPKLMRDLRLFQLYDRAENSTYKVASIHDEHGYRRLRSALARQYDVGVGDANIQVSGADLQGDRRLHLTHLTHRGVPLHESTRELVCLHVERLWGHEVVLVENDGEE